MAFTHIPPIQCLVTFEAVARLRSASRAADELCVTVSAVSHRLRQLEAQLGVKLFARNDFTLTGDGVHYLQNVCAGLAALGQLPAGGGRGAVPRLRVAVTPTFSRQLLMPRLELFRAAYPDVELTLQVSIPLLDVIAEEADLEIRFGTGGYPDREYRRVLGDVITPACSPSYLNRTRALRRLFLRGRIRPRAPDENAARALGAVVRRLRRESRGARRRCAVQRPGSGL